MATRPPLNIPIEVFRTAVVIADVGTFTKAATRLGISQPAVSAQVKRLQQIVGGEIFHKDVGRIVPTSLGNTVLTLARKVLETHDQILRLSASDVGPDRVRLGFSPLLVGQFMSAQATPGDLINVFVQSDNSKSLMRGMIDERLDISCCFVVGDIHPELKRFVIAEREDDLVWVRSESFVLSPGRPIPIVAWRGDDWMTQTLSQHGLPYQVVFDSEDFEAKRSAVEAGQGITALPNRLVPASVTRAREYYLPPLPAVRTILFARSAQRSTKHAALVDRIHELFFSGIAVVPPQRDVG